MAKLVKVHSKRAAVYLTIQLPDETPDYVSVYKQIRKQPLSADLPKLEGDLASTVKDMEAIYARLKASY